MKTVSFFPVKDKTAVDLKKMIMGADLTCAQVSPATKEASLEKARQKGFII